MIEGVAGGNVDAAAHAARSTTHGSAETKAALGVEVLKAATEVAESVSSLLEHLGAGVDVLA